MIHMTRETLNVHYSEKSSTKHSRRHLNSGISSMIYVSQVNLSKSNDTPGQWIPVQVFCSHANGVLHHYGVTNSKLDSRCILLGDTHMRCFWFWKVYEMF